MAATRTARLAARRRRRAGRVAGAERRGLLEASDQRDHGPDCGGSEPRVSIVAGCGKGRCRRAPWGRAPGVLSPLAFFPAPGGGPAGASLCVLVPQLQGCSSLEWGTTDADFALSMSLWDLSVSRQHCSSRGHPRPACRTRNRPTWPSASWSRNGSRSSRRSSVAPGYGLFATSKISHSAT
jgi:hypothetical protein